MRRRRTLPRRRAGGRPPARCRALPRRSDEEVRTQDNVAVAVTETNGDRAFDFSWELIRQKRGDVGLPQHRPTRRPAARIAAPPRSRSRSSWRGATSAWQIVPRQPGVAINECTRYARLRRRAPVRASWTSRRGSAARGATLADVRDGMRAIEGADLEVDEQKVATDQQ